MENRIKNGANGSGAANADFGKAYAVFGCPDIIAKEEISEDLRHVRHASKTPWEMKIALADIEKNNRFKSLVAEILGAEKCDMGFCLEGRMPGETHRQTADRLADVLKIYKDIYSRFHPDGEHFQGAVLYDNGSELAVLNNI